MSKELYETKQFKIVTGEEIIAEVVQWNMDDEQEVVLRKAMKLVLGERAEDNFRYYSFRPWMVYQESPNDFIILNASHIVGIAQPVDSLMYQYHDALKGMLEVFQSRQESVKSGGMGDTNELTQQLRDALDEFEDNDDNVVPFIDPKKLH
jgi:hypothetical protein